LFRSCLRCGASGEAGPNNQHEMGGEGGRGKQGRCGGGMVLVEARSPLRTMGLGGGCGTAEGGGGQCLLFDMWFALRCFFLQNNIDIVF
jgi:hypothetical protein